MNRPVPPELYLIGLDADKFKWFGKNELHGPCVYCGGKDRFVIWTDREFPHWTWICRQCHPESGWIDHITPNLVDKLPPEEMARRRLDAAERTARDLEDQIKKAQRVLAELRESQAWLRYHQQMTDEARTRWESWGVPDFYQEFWKLGYDPDRVIFSGGLEWHTPTMTIPIFEQGTWDVLNIKHRLLKPPKEGDKYRPERAGLPQSLFIADPDYPLTKKLLLVEGEKKAMVSFITADDPLLQVVGIPGKNPCPDLLEKLNDCEPIYILLDPDGRNEAHELAKKMGKDRCRILELPGKVDDLIIKYKLGKRWMRNMIKQGVRV